MKLPSKTIYPRSWAWVVNFFKAGTLMKRLFFLSAVAVVLLSAQQMRRWQLSGVNIGTQDSELCVLAWKARTDESKPYDTYSIDFKKCEMRKNGDGPIPFSRVECQIWDQRLHAFGMYSAESSEWYERGGEVVDRPEAVRAGR
jgi:hypothetical protein